jgi:two-component system, chemotaxis family, sensor kinase CheA
MESAQDPEFIGDFLVEAHEGLDALDSDLVALETKPQDRPTLDRIYRTLHTLKGNASFLGLVQLESLAHAGETLLTAVVEGKVSATQEIVTTLLRVVDAIREIARQLEMHGVEGAADHSSLLARLKVVEQTPNAPAPRPNAPPRNQIGEILVRKGILSREDIDHAVTLQNQGDPRRIGEILVELGKARSEDIVDALHEIEHERAMQKKVRTVRLDTELLDRLLRLADEMVPACNQMLDLQTALRDSTQRVTRLMEEIRDGVARTRRQPISTLWERLPRVVRDLAISCNKRVQIVIEGADTPVDKDFLEALQDPMTHIVRNAVDHGIESPELRSECGKPEEGLLSLRAQRDGTTTRIEISDDGAGVDLERVRAKGLERNLITPERAAQMSDTEILDLIFLPGFSTADHVSNISGRGVGMDVVKFNIEAAGGTVELTTQRGKGSTLRIAFDG